LADEKGIATCLDVATGRIVWRQRFGGKFTASPVSAGGKIFFTDETGSTLVVDATDSQYREVARNEIGEPVYASAAISQGKMFIRTAKNLVCIGNGAR